MENRRIPLHKTKSIYAESLALVLNVFVRDKDEQDKEKLVQLLLNAKKHEVNILEIYIKYQQFDNITQWGTEVIEMIGLKGMLIDENTD